MATRREHPFANRWNHNTHYFPLLASRVPAAAERLLDIGCGEGTFCRYLARARRLVVGADLDSSALPRASHGVRYVATSADALGFADETFAVVTMTMVLHHVDAETALAEAARVLAPGGLLLILGFGRSGGLRDVPHEVRDVPHEVRDLVTHRAVSRRMTPWDPPTVKAGPALTWADAKATAQRALPGSNYRRLALWRYLVEWQKPRDWVKPAAGPG